MAIDTKAKRMSMLSFASPLAWQHHFEVDGSVDVDDRLTLLHLYGGIAAGAPPASGTSYRLHRGKSVGHRFVSTVELTVGDAEISENSNANP